MKSQKLLSPLPGAPVLIACILLLIIFPVGIVVMSSGSPNSSAMSVLVFAMVVTYVISITLLGGLTVIEPNGACLLLLFGGAYKGSIHEGGFFWVNPFCQRKRISLRAMTLNGDKLKVNDKAGNPVEIAAIIVWKVVDSYKAKFDVDSFESFVQLQSETALRHIAGSYEYDADGGEISLMHNSQVVLEQLQVEIQARVERAGIEIIEARLSHLAYAPEIAAVMLRKQQAAAVISARQKIVDGAVGMVELALGKFEQANLVNLDEERKAAMVSNLMIVLCSESSVQPVINAGTLYP